MKIKVAPDYETMSQQAAEALLQIIGNNKKPLLCTASGDSPAGLYRALAAEVKAQGIDISDWHFVGLDEWAGMNGGDEGSCRYHLDRQLFQLLEVDKQQICFFDGRAQNREMECERIEAFIKQHGGIDVAIVGIGLNGHIGMNEPGTPAQLRSHVAGIAPQTQQTGQKYFKTPQSLTHGLTLGLQTIMEAKHVFLMASGAHKAEIIEKTLSAPASEELPATLLRQHEGLAIFLDEGAASKMQPQSNTMG